MVTNRIGNSHARLRRLRNSPELRHLVAEHSLKVSDLIAPIFVSEAGTQTFPIPSLPGVFRIPLDKLEEELELHRKLGISAVLLFPVNDPSKKDLLGKEAYNPDGLVQAAVKKTKTFDPRFVVMADVALDPFTTHGHDGITDDSGYVVNDKTVEALCKMSVTLAEAGVDFVAPSDMMDGRVAAIRHALDERGFERTGILAYSVKYNSAFYGPFREAVASGARGLDKGTYQLNPANVREGLREVSFDVAEGSDMVMVKPATPYLDMICRTRSACEIPVVAYHVSGEYAMLKAAVQNGWLDEERAVKETLVGIKRAGADLIVTYYAKWIAEKLQK